MICSTTYDPADRPVGSQGRRDLRHGPDRKAGWLRRQGQHHPGRASGDGGDGTYRLTGHKWFCSAPMSDAFLMLAQAPGGISCFLAPRWRPDGTRNAIRIQRLKDKLGDRSNASSEIELAGRLGPTGRRGGPGRAHDHRDGQPHPARLHPGLHGHHAPGGGPGLVARRPPVAFGKLLAEQPLMANVLADLALESEAATTAALRLARAYDAPHRATSRRASSSAC